MNDVDLDLLIHRYFDRSLSDAEEETLFARVRSSPAAADRFVELSELESGLVENFRAAEEAPSGVRRAVAAPPRRAVSAPRRALWPIVAAAAGVLIAVLVLLLRPSAPPKPPLAAAPPILVSPRRALPETAAPAPKAPPAPAPKTPESAPLLPLPAPAPRPVPPPVEPADAESQKPAPRPSTAGETRIAVATLERVEGEVSLVGEVAALPLEAGRPIPEGRGLATRAGSATLRLADGTRLELGGDTLIEKLEPKRVLLSRGVLVATVAKQPAKASFVVLTPQAEVTVLGTKFTLNVAAEQTRVDVEEGRVRCRRASDGASVEIGANFTATAGKGGPLSAKPWTRVLAFQDGLLPTPAYAGTQDSSISMQAPTETAGAAILLRVHKNADHQNAALIRWDVSAIPPGSKVLAAELTFWITGSMSGPGCRVHELRRSWSEADATWKFPWQIAGSLGDADRGSRPIAALTPAQYGLYTAPLNEDGMALVQKWVNDKNGNFGVEVAGAFSGPAWDLDSRESAAPERRPKLTVTFVAPAK